MKNINSINVGKSVQISSKDVDRKTSKSISPGDDLYMKYRGIEKQHNQHGDWNLRQKLKIIEEHKFPKHNDATKTRSNNIDLTDNRNQNKFIVPKKPINEIAKPNDNSPNIPRHRVNFGETELISGSEQSDNDPPLLLHIGDNEENIIYKDNLTQTCKPKRNICFLKTHKCSSSTIQNILFRWGDDHDVTFVLPRSNRPYLGSPSLFNRVFAMPSFDGKYNILANHARYNKQGMSSVMPGDSIYVTVLRDPAKQFESIYNYYRLNTRFNLDLTHFIDQPMRYFRRQQGALVSGRNPMLFDLGFDAAYIEPEDRKVDDWIQQLETDFHLVLIAEYFQESMILLKNELCWGLSDVVSFKQNQRSKSSVRTTDPVVADKIRRWNGADMKLYNHFNKTLWKKIEAYGIERMKNEVTSLQKLTEEFKRTCIGSTRDFGDPRMWYPSGVRVKSYVINPDAKDNRICSQLTRPELSYISLLRKKLINKNIKHASR
ncbi:galactose-3-O-sulfotransferase 2-like [Antedon mediterranea]|uniref:galactose-3-O-sulfotransferase 2-like n=1 Tax=Antedon mediterranea TaxID=105859 RepID=UPI003AF63C76